MTSERNDHSLVSLPEIHSAVVPSITQLTEYLRIPRDVLASEEEINYAWMSLPRELSLIPENVEKALIARMLIAISTGLFDSAINYIWNTSILNLREKVRRFGLSVISQIKTKDFDEKNLVGLQDSELLILCHQLNILDDNAFFLLDQCREVRNNFSAAHPPLGNINDRELINFIDRCCLYALNDNLSPRGVNFNEFIMAVNGSRFTPNQIELWSDLLKSTHDAQRMLLIRSLHGIYCDPDSQEVSRLNSLDLCNELVSTLNAEIRSELINAHTNYLAKGDSTRHKASRLFFENLGILNLLSEAERHTIITNATGNLWRSHTGLNNFYNEPPFANRLLELSKSGEIPDTAKEEFVRTIVACYIGNGFGVSWAAEIYYKELIQDFSPKEVSILISLTTTKGVIKNRVDSSTSCRSRFKMALQLIDENSLPSSVKIKYSKLIKSLS